VESKLLKSLVVLGVPGVALGIFYLLLKRLNFNFDTISSTWAASIAILFLLVVGWVTTYAIHRFAPPHHSLKEGTNSPYEKSGAFKANLYFFLGNNKAGPSSTTFYSHHKPEVVLNPKLDEAFNLPPSMRSEVARSIFWKEGGYFLKPSLTYKQQGVHEGHTLLITDNNNSEIVSLISQTLS